MEPPPAKKQRRSDGDVTKPAGSSSELLSRPISPPLTKKKHDTRLVPSPFQLTTIRDLPPSQNVDAVSLNDLLGDPLISECWDFNYLHDIQFLMDAFDEDTRGLVKAHVVHGFWKREDPHRRALVDQATHFENVQLHAAPMDEMFGTHHSKMLILFRHDDTAQVIIHTANMIAKDWTNMTNAVWRSPPLPLLPSKHVPAPVSSRDDYPVGSGERFKFDLLNYLKAYDSRRITCQPLSKKLVHYDFCGVHACLIASVPGKHQPNDATATAWGWPAVKRTLRSVPCQTGKSEVVVQISSIATLGATDKWIQESLFGALTPSSNLGAMAATRPAFKVVFPTASEIRRSLDGYDSGSSIHTKIQQPQQEKQLRYLRPIFHHWANDALDGEADGGLVRDSGRNRAAPHVKTYIRYNEGGSIDWALLTSANLSKQAWGDNASQQGEVKVSSWEIGVLVWPELLEGQGAIMRGAFRQDMPTIEASDDGKPVVGLRIPYSVPLKAYRKDEVPWVATMSHPEPDWMGRDWSVRGR